VVKGLGVDLFDVARLSQRFGDAPDLIDRLFTAAEMGHCRRHRHPDACFARVFAAKEAVFKALSLDDGRGCSWQEVEIRSSVSRDTVILHGDLQRAAHGRRVTRIHLSTFSTRRLAGASVVLES
jgi:holo-[acyl-carrier protein] synthase